jgi:hypothetical protein
MTLSSFDFFKTNVHSFIVIQEISTAQVRLLSTVNSLKFSKVVEMDCWYMYFDEIFSKLCF